MVDWLVTGANGQLGRELQAHLKESQKEIVFLDKQALNICNQQSVLSIMEKMKPKVVINCAGWTDVDKAESAIAQTFLTNAHGAENISLAAKTAGAKLLHLSSDYVFDGKSGKSMYEDSPRNPISIYGKSKAEGEDRIIQTYPQGSFIIRTAWLYGAYGSNFVKWLVRKGQNNQASRIIDDQFGQPTSTSDLASAIISIADNEIPPGIYHATNSGEISWYEFARKIFEIADLSFQLLEPVSQEVLGRAASRPSHSVLSNEKLRDVGIPILPTWQDSLNLAMPEILKKIESELAYEG